jgi:hypothetical protein
MSNNDSIPYGSFDYGSDGYKGGPLSEGPCVFGKGFVSQFLAVADSFQNMTLDQPLAVKTEHKNIGFYDPAYLVPVPPSPAPGS